MLDAKESKNWNNRRLLRSRIEQLDVSVVERLASKNAIEPSRLFQEVEPHARMSGFNCEGRAITDVI